MTNLNRVCCIILSQLQSVVEQIHPSDYVKPSTALSGSSIGQHIRHTLEFFVCFQHGFDTGIINYDSRAHDRLIETNKDAATQSIKVISNFVAELKTNTILTLEVSYDRENNQGITLQSNASRELVYNIEHAVHHMAIMKIGIREVAPYILLPPDFGVAASTIRYQKTEPRTK